MVMQYLILIWKKIFKYHKQKKAKITFIGCEAILNYGIVE